MKNLRKLINWAELSRKLTGSKDSVRNTFVPSSQKETVDNLISKIEEWDKERKVKPKSNQL